MHPSSSSPRAGTRTRITPGRGSPRSSLLSLAPSSRTYTLSSWTRASSSPLLELRSHGAATTISSRSSAAPPPPRPHVRPRPRPAVRLLHRPSRPPELLTAEARPRRSLCCRRPRPPLCQAPPPACYLASPTRAGPDPAIFHALGRWPWTPLLHRRTAASPRASVRRRCHHKPGDRFLPLTTTIASLLLPYCCVVRKSRWRPHASPR